MSFTESVKTCFSNYATFEGRARRSEFWYFYLMCFLANLVCSAIGNAIGGGVSIIFSIIPLALLIPMLAVSWRRLHDIGKSGGWYFIGLIPVVGTILLIVWLAKDGEPGTNQYGPNPKEIGDIYV